MSTFRDAIAKALRAHGAHTPTQTAVRFYEGGDMFGPDADAVLAMPEMQAIREALRDKYHWEARQTFINDGLPESVIAWVLDGQT